MVLEKVPGMPCQWQPATFTIFGLIYGDDLALRIHVTPPQAEDLHFACSRRKGKHNYRVQGRVRLALHASSKCCRLSSESNLTLPRGPRGILTLGIGESSSQFHSLDAIVSTCENAERDARTEAGARVSARVSRHWAISAGGRSLRT